ncbi:copper transporter [Chengkuizengella axinellae]|uniref:Copper transporter n=1 Tax=Chengkuizengella axinellae TaxID=3064388 RepID=A0ABT9IW72_9BACL|nr:copper transporter [Chengkuizengella sp. 2205SS18-9]MDP5273619.1 copper transporter [Chengkuizengella sp. 2205SS18-9]
MVPSRFYLITVISIFLALGIGIFIGGTMGQQWINQTEKNIAESIMEKYETQLSINQELQNQIGSLQLLNQKTTPIFQHKKMMWVSSEDVNKDMLAFAIQSEGGEWIESPVNEAPDLVMVSEGQSDFMSNQMNRWHSFNEQAHPIIVQVSPNALPFDEPQEIVNFMLFIKKIMEEDSNAAIGVYNYPSLE